MRQLWYLFLLLIMGLAWGAEFSTLKLAIAGGHDEFTVLMVALVLISVAYFLILLFRRSLFRVTREIFVFLAITAMLGYLIPLLAALYAAPYLSAGIMTLIVSLTPVVTVSVALLLRTERVSFLRIASIGLGMVATWLVLAPETELPGRGVFAWMLLMAIVPICYGVESIYVSARWPGGLDAWQVGFGEAVVAIVLLLPAYAVFGDPTSIGLSWSLAETGIVLFVLSGLINIVLYFYIIQHTGGVLVSFGSFISLFVGIGWGMLIFSERHGMMVWFAVIVLIGALVLVCVDTLRNRPAGTLE